MKSVLFDFVFYQGADFHGGGEYGKAVLNEVLEREDIGKCGLFFIQGRIVDKQMIERCVARGFRIHYGTDRRNVTSIVKEYGYDAIYTPLPYAFNWHELNLPSNVNFICTFHGLRTIELSDFTTEEKAFFSGDSAIEIKVAQTENALIYDSELQSYGNVLNAFDNYKMFVDSEHTKHSLYRYYPETQYKDLEVLYPPEKLSEQGSKEEEKIFLDKWNLKKGEFGLLVSAGIWYKNALRGALAYDRVFDNKYQFIPESFKVIVLGVKNKEKFLERLHNKERFILMGYIKDVELEFLYKNAHLFLYPSLNEGFGYPPLEAMKYGTLCACSVNTSISEICGDMVLYFNPFLINEIMIRSILESFSDNIREEKKRIIEKNFPKLQERQKKDLQRLVDIIIGD